VLLDLVKIFELDRVVLKSFNTLIAMMILPEKDNIVRYLSKNCNDAVSMLDNAMPQSAMDEQTERSIEYLLLFIKESLKFILFGYFKRCRIITHILLNIKKNF